MAANYWTGAAQSIKQQDTITIGGTWVLGETMRVTIGKAYCEVTIGADVATTDVAEALSAALNATDDTVGLVGTETRNIGAQERGEFQDLEATVSGSVVTLTGTVAGRPYVFATTETSTSGTVADASVVVATGSNHADNVDNWSLGALATTDVLTFNEGNIDCLYGLDQNVDRDGLTRTGAYTGNIGLAATNGDHFGFEYPEYRVRSLSIEDVGNLAQIRLGDGTGSNQGRTVITSAAKTAFYYINDTAAPSATGLNPIELTSTAGAGTEVYQTAGNTDIGTRYGGGMEMEHIHIYGGRARIEGTFNAAAELKVGGIVESHNALTNCTDLLEVNGGTLIHFTGACPAIDVRNGALDYRSTGALTAATMQRNGLITFENDQVAKTVTNLYFHSGASLLDNNGVAIPSGDYHFIDCAPNDLLTLRMPKNLKYSPVAL